MRTKQVKISNLKFAKYNPRQISNDDMASLVNSIREFGMVEPVVVNKGNTVVGGHQRIIAAKQLSIDTVPVVYVDLSKKKEKILNLGLNRIHGDWDMEKLAVVLEELKMNDGDDLSLTGFSEIEIGEIRDSQMDTDEDEDNFDAKREASKIKKPKTKRGEVYQLGRHRLMCGDATCKEDVEKLMDGKKADMVFTDPPYNVQKEGESWDSKSETEYRKFTDLWFSIAQNQADVLLFTPGTGRYLANFKFWSEIHKPDWILIWVKNNTLTHSPIGGFQAWEPLLLYGQPKNRIPQDIYICPIIVQSDVEEDGKKLHPTPKQVKLWVMILKDFINRDDVVLDLFGGSGTTLIACEKTERICYMLEIDPIYCDVIRNRYEKYVGENKRKIA